GFTFTVNITPSGLATSVCSQSFLPEPSVEIYQPSWPYGVPLYQGPAPTCEPTFTGNTLTGGILTFTTAESGFSESYAVYTTLHCRYVPLLGTSSVTVYSFVNNQNVFSTSAIATGCLIVTIPAVLSPGVGSLQIQTPSQLPAPQNGQPYS